MTVTYFPRNGNFIGKTYYKSACSALISMIHSCFEFEAIPFA